MSESRGAVVSVSLDLNRMQHCPAQTASSPFRIMSFFNAQNKVAIVRCLLTILLSRMSLFRHKDCTPYTWLGDPPS